MGAWLQSALGTQGVYTPVGPGRLPDSTHPPTQHSTAPSHLSGLYAADLPDLVRTAALTSRGRPAQPRGAPTPPPAAAPAPGPRGRPRLLQHTACVTGEQLHTCALIGTGRTPNLPA